MNTITDQHESERRKSVWMRGLFMLVFAFLLEIAGTVLLVVTIIQFFSLLFGGQKNSGLTRFGRSLGRWFRDVIRFQTINSDEKPFPWAPWPDEASHDK